MVARKTGKKASFGGNGPERGDRQTQARTSPSGFEEFNEFGSIDQFQDAPSVDSHLRDDLSEGLQQPQPLSFQAIGQEILSALKILARNEGLAAELNRLLVSIPGLLRTRLTGDYIVDEFGYDPTIFRTFIPFLRFFYHSYWRCKIEGLEHIPAEGPALIVANRSGFMPWDAEMLRFGISEMHAAHRFGWILHGPAIARLPFVNVFFNRTARVLQCPSNTRKLLQRGDLVIGFPEGERGGWNTYDKRFRLANFYESFLFQTAMELKVPVIPAVIIGAELAYPLLAKYPVPKKAFNIPFFPVTPFFPWLPPPWCFLALPITWRIKVLPPLEEGADSDSALRVDEMCDSCYRTMRKSILDIIKSHQNLWLD